MDNSPHYFMKRLRSFSERNNISWEKWDEEGLYEIAIQIAEIFKKDDGWENIFFAFEKLAKWNKPFRSEKKVMMQFLTSVQSSIFCEDYEDVFSQKPTKVWNFERCETNEMIEKRKILRNEMAAKEFQNKILLEEEKKAREEEKNQWETVKLNSKQKIQKMKPKVESVKDKNVKELFSLFPNMAKNEIINVLEETNNNLDEAATKILQISENLTGVAAVDDFCFQLDQIEKQMKIPTESKSIKKYPKKPSMKMKNRTRLEF